MTLEEAIRHCEEVAEELEKKANIYEIKNTYLSDSQSPVDCLSCAADHRQFAKWLTELKEARAELDRLYPILENARILSNAVFEFKEKFFDKYLNEFE